MKREQNTMRSFLSYLPLPLIAVQALLLCGCGNDSRVVVHPTQLRVLFNGTPAIGAEVLLHPKSEELRAKQIFPNGRVNAEGLVELTTYEAGDGAPAGSYAVTITWTQSLGGSDDPEAAESPTDRLAGRFANPEKSGLEVEITSEGPNEKTFKLGRP